MTIEKYDSSDNCYRGSDELWYSADGKAYTFDDNYCSRLIRTLPDSDLYHRPHFEEDRGVWTRDDSLHDWYHENRLNRCGNPWTHEEEELISWAFRNDFDLDQIAYNIDRTSKAVRSRLVQLGLLEPGYKPAWQRR